MSGAHACLNDTALRASFDADGYVSIAEFLDRQELNDVLSIVEHVIVSVVPTMPAADVYFEDVRDPSSLKQLQRLHEHDGFLRTLLRRGPFAQLARTLLGEEPVPQNLQYFDKAPGANSPTPAHQDGAYFLIEPMNAITIWLALEDVGHEQGCVRYVRGSHRKGLRPHRPSEVLGFSRQLESPEPTSEAREVDFPCSAGHVIAHHALTVHRANGNESLDRHRRALGFIYYGASCEIDEVATELYQSRLAARLQAADRLGPN